MKQLQTTTKTIMDKLDTISRKSKNEFLNSILIALIPSLIILWVGWKLNSELENDKNFSNKISMVSKLITESKENPELTFPLYNINKELFKDKNETLMEIKNNLFSIIKSYTKQACKRNNIEELVVVSKMKAIAESVNGELASDYIRFVNSDDYVCNKKVTNIEKALNFEKNGFYYLQKYDIYLARKNFDSAYKYYPELHNVQEIKDLLSNPNLTIKELYEKIVKEYFWKAPSDAIQFMQNYIKSN